MIPYHNQFLIIVIINDWNCIGLEQSDSEQSDFDENALDDEMLGGEFEEMFNIQQNQEETPQINDEDTEVDVVGEPEGDETEKGETMIEFDSGTLGDAALGGIFSLEQKDFDERVGQLKDDLLATKPTMPKRITGTGGIKNRFIRKTAINSRNLTPRYVGYKNINVPPYSRTFQ